MEPAEIAAPLVCSDPETTLALPVTVRLPAFPWLFEKKLDLEVTPKKLEALRMLGVPYTDADIANATEGLEDKSQADAVIAYMQQLGTILKERR